MPIVSVLRSHCSIVNAGLLQSFWLERKKRLRAKLHNIRNTENEAQPNIAVLCCDKTLNTDDVIRQLELETLLQDGLIGAHSVEVFTHGWDHTSSNKLVT